MSADQLLGQSVEVEGHFVLVAHEGYLVASIDERDNKRMALKLDVAELKRIVMSRVPPSGGSKYYYLDEAIVTGTLEQCEGGEFEYSLQNVTSLTIYKSGESFVVIP
jgi:hypothetical protein